MDSDDVYLIIRAEGGGIKRWEMVFYRFDSPSVPFCSAGGRWFHID